MIIKTLFIFLVLPAILIFSCNKSDESTNPTFQEKKIDKNIIACDSAPQPSSLLFGKIIQWQGQFNPSRGDSVAEMFRTSNIPISELWYPNESSKCMSPLPMEKEIIKLSRPDTNIYSMGYSSLNSFSWCCIGSWRHYLFQ